MNYAYLRQPIFQKLSLLMAVALLAISVFGLFCATMQTMHHEANGGRADCTTIAPDYARPGLCPLSAGLLKNWSVLSQAVAPGFLVLLAMVAVAVVWLAHNFFKRLYLNLDRYRATRRSQPPPRMYAAWQYLFSSGILHPKICA